MTNARAPAGFGGLLDALAYLQKLDPDLSVLSLRALLVVADHPDGIGMSAVSANLEVNSGTASVIFSRLSRHGRLGKPGLDLVECDEQPGDRRKKVARLTTKGQQVLERLNELRAA